MSAEPLPDPAVIVLAGAAGSGKSHWAAERFRRTEVVSSDALRAVVGSGPADLEATADAFELLDRIATIRIGRRLTTVIDTLGLEPERRRSYLARARDAGLPAVLVIIDTDPRLCRERNARRDRPVPAPALTDSCEGGGPATPRSRTRAGTWCSGSGSRPTRPRQPSWPRAEPGGAGPTGAAGDPAGVPLPLGRPDPAPWLVDLAAAAPTRSASTAWP